jgi:serine/threonine-protein kinase RsbT
VAVTRREELPLRSAADVVTVRQVVRGWATEQGLSLVDQTKLVTAASELARNTVDYGKGGTAILEAVVDGGRRGVRITFVDKGPGISDIPRALTDGYTTGKGLGLGLGGARRLSNEFEIQSTVGQGTTIVIARWR